MDLKELTNLLIEDCLEFGLDTKKIEYIFSNVKYEKIMGGGHDVLSFYYDEEEGYCFVYWDKGYPINGIHAKTTDDFRFAFQCYNKTIYDFPIDSSTPREQRLKLKEEWFMGKMASKFGHTIAYQKKLKFFKELWSEFTVSNT